MSRSALVKEKRERASETQDNTLTACLLFLLFLPFSQNEWTKKNKILVLLNAVAFSVSAILAITYNVQRYELLMDVWVLLLIIVLIVWFFSFFLFAHKEFFLLFVIKKNKHTHAHNSQLAHLGLYTYYNMCCHGTHTHIISLSKIKKNHHFNCVVVRP